MALTVKTPKPLLPATFVNGVSVAGLSTSVIVNAPLVVRTAFVSVRFTVGAEITAGSLTAETSMVTVRVNDSPDAASLTV